MLEALKKVSWCYLGYGLLEAWAICLIYNRNNLGLVSLFGFDYANPDFSTLSFLSTAGVVIASLGVMLYGLAREDAFERRASWTVGAATVSVLGTLMLFFGNFPVAVAGIFLTGLGNGWLWISWGDVYASLETAERDMVAICSAVLQAVVAVFIMVLPTVAQLAAIALLIPLACVCYIMSLRTLSRAEKNTETDVGPTIETDVRFMLRFVLGFGIPTATVNYLLGHDAALPSVAGGFDLVLAAGLLLFVIVFGAFVILSRRLDIVSFCKISSSMLVVVTVMVAFGFMPFLGNAIAISCEVLCQYFILVFCGRLVAHRAGTVPVVFGFGMLANHAAGAIGALLAIVVDTGLPAVGTDGLVPVVILAMMFFLALAVGSRDPQALGALAESSTTAARVTSAGRSLDDSVNELSHKFGLTQRESEVLKLLARGRSAPFIRDELSVSLNTVSYHIKNIYAKLGVHSRQELIGLVSHDGANPEIMKQL